MKKQRGTNCFFCVVLLWGLLSAAAEGQGGGGQCLRVELDGAVTAGSAWSAAIGGGWTLRLVPIAPGKQGYTGWDVAVERASAAGYPDAVLLATAPYLSMNEREIGTTYGLRAQDAIGWNPRSFRFLTDPRDFAEARGLFLRHSPEWGAGRRSVEGERAAARLMELSRGAAGGQLEIVDARLVEGTGDAVSYARNWALQAARTPHTSEKGAPAPQGALRSMRFRVRLWLPEGWSLPSPLAGRRDNCQR